MRESNVLQVLEYYNYLMQSIQRRESDPYETYENTRWTYCRNTYNLDEDGIYIGNQEKVFEFKVGY